jgi:hypothetical protein
MAEPYRIKTVEPLHITSSRAEREAGSNSPVFTARFATVR